jgi:hypothetical protein
MGTMAQLIAGYNPRGFVLGNQNLAAEVAQRKAQTGLTGAETQTRQLQNQAAQIALRDDDILSRAFRDATGDPERTGLLAIQYGISPGGWFRHRDSTVKLLKAGADLTKEQHENVTWTNEQIGAAYSGLLQLSPEKRAEAAPATFARIRELDPNHVFPQNLDDDSLTLKVAHANFLGKLLTQRKEQVGIAQTEAATKEAQQKIAGTERTQAAQDLSGLVNPQDGSIDPQTYQQWRQGHPTIKAPAIPSAVWNGHFIASAVSIEKQPEYLLSRSLTALKPGDLRARVDALNLPPELASRTKLLVDQALQLGDRKGALAAIKDASDQVGRTETAVRTAEATKPIKIETIVAGEQAKLTAGGATEDDFRRAGEQYAITGVMPPLGLGAASRTKIMHHAQEFARENNLTPRDLATAQAAFQGDVTSLKRLQTMRDSVVSFEKTALANVDLFLETAKPLIDANSPIINTPLRLLAGKVKGSAEVAAFEAARRVAINEVAKVTSNPNLTGQLSDAARKEVESFIPENATLKQIYAVTSVLRRDMANRHQSMDAMLGEIRQRIGGAVTPPAETKEESWGRDATGKLVKR